MSYSAKSKINLGGLEHKKSLSQASGHSDDKAYLCEIIDQVIEDGGVKECRVADDSLNPIVGAIQLPHFRMTLTIKGERVLEYAQNGQIQDHEMQSGTLLMIPPLAWTRTIFPKECSSLGMVFHKDYTRIVYHPFTRYDFKPEEIPIWHHIQGPISGLARDVLSTLRQVLDSQGDMRTVKFLVNALLGLFLERLKNDRDEGGTSQRQWQHLMTYVEENCHLPLSRQDVASQLKIHPNHLSRLFREQGGESFKQVLIRLRMKLAERLLHDPILNISEVGQRCGYKETGHFIRVFRQQFGSPPGRYRDKI